MGVIERDQTLIFSIWDFKENPDKPEDPFKEMTLIEVLKCFEVTAVKRYERITVYSCKKN